MKCVHTLGNRTFMRLFTSAENGSIIEVSYNSHHPNYSSLDIKYLGNSTSWDVGLIDTISVYLLTHSHGKFNLYKDGEKLHENSGDTRQNSPPTHTGQSTNTGPTNNIESFYVTPPPHTTSKNAHHDKHSHVYFINKPYLINPNKDFQGFIKNLFGFHIAINSEQADAIYRYFQCSPCQRVHPAKPHFPIKPIPEHVITKVKEEQHHIIEEEHGSRERRCKILIDKEEKKKKDKKISVICDAHRMRSHTPNESHNIVNKLVKDFNTHEEQVQDSCSKVVYHVRPDGKIVRKKMKLPNCNDCTGETVPQPTHVPHGVNTCPPEKCT